MTTFEKINFGCHPLQAFVLSAMVEGKIIKGFAVKTEEKWAVFNEEHDYLGTVQPAFINDDKPNTEATKLILEDYRKAIFAGKE